MVREVRDSALPATTTLCAQEVRDGAAHHEHEAPGKAGTDRRTRAVLDDGRRCLAAELDGTFAGSAYATAYRTRAGHKHGRWLGNLQMLRALGAGCAHPPTEP